MRGNKISLLRMVLAKFDRNRKGAAVGKKENIYI